MLLFLVYVTVFVQESVYQRSSVSGLNTGSCETDAFRRQKLKPEIYEEIQEVLKTQFTSTFSDILTVTMLSGDFTPDKITADNSAYLKYKEREYTILRDCYEAVWADVQFFPVAGEDISYEDTWLASRTYGGERQHEGTDLFGKVDVSGYYPVISMTDGVIEQKGWLPLGGYRIGIRSPQGGYFYYAHLSGYEKDYEIGESVSAGDIIGYMGNTGYGEEGTAGKFPVHLHLGIYIETPSQKEMSVNPFWILKSCEKKLRKYLY